MPDWKSKIRDAWNAALPPGDPILKEEARAGWSDAADAERWLAGKRWDDISSDHDRLDVEMPLFYLSDSACSYYLGGYLLHFTEAFEHECLSCLAPVHFAGFMESDRFASVLPRLSREQRSVLSELSAAMLQDADLFGLDADFSAKLRAGVRLLTEA